MSEVADALRAEESPTDANVLDFEIRAMLPARSPKARPPPPTLHILTLFYGTRKKTLHGIADYTTENENGDPLYDGFRIHDATSFGVAAANSAGSRRQCRHALERSFAAQPILWTIGKT
jgi:hypothetical protein